MDKERATQIAKELIRKAFLNQETKILLSDTADFQRGWVFFYNTEEFIKNPTPENGVFQSIPILIDKLDGTVYRFFDPIRRFTDCLTWLDDYILIKKYAKDSNERINHFELDYYELSTTGELINEELMIIMANEIISKTIEANEKDKLMDFLNRNLLDKDIWENIWIKQRLKSRNRINEILNKNEANC